MAELGKWLVIIGIGSFALNFFGMEFKLLMWIDSWGVSTGYLIRAAFIMVGAVLFCLGMKSSVAEEESFDDIQVPAE